MSEQSPDAKAALAADPRPTSPEEPGPGECCESGCDPCVWDFYNQERDHYRRELAAWLARHPDQP